MISAFPASWYLLHRLIESRFRLESHINRDFGLQSVSGFAGMAELSVTATDSTGATSNAVAMFISNK